MTTRRREISTACRRGRALLAAMLGWLVVAAAGCSSLPGSDGGDGLHLAKPSPAFLKKVERDPFPRAVP